MKPFISIDNDLFKLEEGNITIFNKINTEGFTLYSALLLLQGQNSFVVTNIKMIRDFVNCKGLKDKRTILKYLMALKRNKLIQCKALNNKTGINTSLIIEVRKNEGKEFTSISNDLFKDKISKIGHIGWSLYCLLYKNHNINFGNQTGGNYGFANCSEGYMSLIINRGTTVIKEHLKILSKQHLIKIIPQDPIVNIKADGTEEYKYIPNHYIVSAKVYNDNKYYIGK